MVSDWCPAIFRNYFEIKENSYDFRTRDHLTIPLTRLTLGQHAVRVKEASLRNKIDKSLLNYTLKNIKAILNGILSKQSLTVNCTVQVLWGKTVITFLAYIYIYNSLSLSIYIYVCVCLYANICKYLYMYIYAKTNCNISFVWIYICLIMITLGTLATLFS